MDYLEEISFIGTSIGAIATAIALVFTARAQLAMAHSTRLQTAAFWVEIAQRSENHNEVHGKLQEGGEWYQSDTEPSAPKDYAQVIRYLNLFEQCKFLMDQGLLDPQAMDRVLLPYRVQLILQNGPIKRNLLHGDHRNYYTHDWSTFIELVEYCNDRYGAKYMFPYWDMLVISSGGAPEQVIHFEKRSYPGPSG
jgi:hypothetical protein